MPCQVLASPNILSMSPLKDPRSDIEKESPLRLAKMLGEATQNTSLPGEDSLVPVFASRQGNPAGGIKDQMCWCCVKNS